MANFYHLLYVVYYVYDSVYNSVKINTKIQIAALVRTDESGIELKIPISRSFLCSAAADCGIFFLYSLCYRLHTAMTLIA